MTGKAERAGLWLFVAAFVLASCTSVQAPSADPGRDWFALSSARLAEARRAVSGPPPIVVRSSTGIATGRIEGRIVDGTTHQPIQAAQVWLEDTQVGELSNAQGAFHLTTSPGRYTLSASRIGYGTVSAEIELEADRGARAEIVLHEESLIYCDMIYWEGGPGSVGVRVWDVVTGRAPRGPVRLRVSDGVDEWSNVGTAVTTDGAAATGAGEGRGPFVIEVTAPGYQPWLSLTGQLPPTDCPSGAIHDVGLVPDR